MKRHALLIGYSGWDLSHGKIPGALLDIQDYKDYLMSPKGGCWNLEEITVLEDEKLDKKTLEDVVDWIRNRDFDVVFSVFSGHGWYDDIKKQCHRLEIGREQDITEKTLWDLARKQILILDSCSGLESCDIPINEGKLISFEKIASNDEKKWIRMYYDSFCGKCPPQQIRLYSAAKGVYARDTSKGGLYSRTLLDICNSEFEPEYLDIVSAHELTTRKIAGVQQTDKLVPRLSRYLPISLNLKFTD